ncbi:MAG: FKBP-type peptidylprolyl isomerase [Planctomycetota bacterium]|nr:MAG: FKBP-type peptidylprolyl isomerase [Planctomycetota bacterium]
MKHSTLLAALAATLLPFAAACAQKGKPVQPKPKSAPTVTKSGLKYWVLKDTKGGASPAMGDQVKVHYSGWLKDGGVLFDSSVQRGQPAEFKLGQVIAGWNEGLQLMTVGDSFYFEIPGHLAYKDRGSPPLIGPNATLMFKVELLGVTVLPKPPAFRKPDPKKLVTTKSGLQYEVLAEGKGERCKANEAFELALALFSKDGNMLMSRMEEGQRIKGSVSAMRLAFLKEAPLLMKQGGKMWVAVPAKLAWGKKSPGQGIAAGETTYWYLEMVRIIKPLPLPKFELPSDDELQKTGSGLKYKVLRKGKGKSPKAYESVKVHYAGWLTNGKSFDSSYSRGEPSQFGVSRVIPGWTEGLQLMKEGSKYLFVIPARIAYGARATGNIPPNSTLVFVVELLEVVR